MNSTPPPPLRAHLFAIPLLLSSLAALSCSKHATPVPADSPIEADEPAEPEPQPFTCEIRAEWGPNNKYNEVEASFVQTDTGKVFFQETHKIDPKSHGGSKSWTLSCPAGPYRSKVQWAPGVLTTTDGMGLPGTKVGHTSRIGFD